MVVAESAGGRSPLSIVFRPRVMTWLRRTFAATYPLLAERLAPESR